MKAMTAMMATQAAVKKGVVLMEMGLSASHHAPFEDSWHPAHSSSAC